MGGGGRNITEVYVGLADGRFVGFTATEGSGVLLLRRAGAAAASDVDWLSVCVGAQCVLEADGNTCCDGTIRVAYDMDASLARATSHGDLHSWSVYDHRERPWYRQAAQRWRETGSASGWSPVYVSHGTQNLVITATGMAAADGHLVGVFAADYVRFKQPTALSIGPDRGG